MARLRKQGAQKFAVTMIHSPLDPYLSKTKGWKAVWLFMENALQQTKATLTNSDSSWKEKPSVKVPQKIKERVFHDVGSITFPHNFPAFQASHYLWAWGQLADHPANADPIPLHNDLWVCGKVGFTDHKSIILLGFTYDLSSWLGKSVRIPRRTSRIGFDFSTTRKYIEFHLQARHVIYPLVNQYSYWTWFICSWFTY